MLSLHIWVVLIYLTIGPYEFNLVYLSLLLEGVNVTFTDPLPSLDRTS